jgi:ketosteroid isomerase-like protein
MSDDQIADVAFRFVERINRQDLEGLLGLMTDDHDLHVFGDHDLSGKEAQREGWRGYFDLCPDYMIHVWEMHVRGDTAVLVGSTTGSHLEQPRLTEFRDPLIWTAKVRDGLVSEWALHRLTDENRERLGIA